MQTTSFDTGHEREELVESDVIGERPGSLVGLRDDLHRGHELFVGRRASEGTDADTPEVAFEVLTSKAICEASDRRLCAAREGGRDRVVAGDST
jgi:hypothetical protein